MKRGAKREEHQATYPMQSKSFSPGPSCFCLYIRNTENQKREKKEGKKPNLEESSQNLHKDSHHLQLSDVPKKEECL